MKKYTVVLAIMAIMAIAAVIAVHAMHQTAAYSLCLVTMCAFIISTVGIAFTVDANTLLVNIPANRGMSIPFRLERPPRI